MKITLLLSCLIFGGTAIAADLGPAPNSLSAFPPQEGDFLTKDFHFNDGSSLPTLKIHYITMGTPHRNASGHVDNAVMVLHGTNRKGAVFMIPGFAGELFGAGQPLDTARYYVVIPDQLGGGLGKSSKPSDGLRAKFPHYDYADMNRANHLLLTEGLHVDHLRLFLGVSQGCMQGFLYGESNPGYMDGLMLLSCNPAEVGGRNRMVRRIMIDDVRNDPGWNQGNYTAQPYGLRAALGHLFVVGSVPTLWQKQYPTAAQADKYMEDYIADNMKTTDANDLIYAYDASRTYNPAADLNKIKAAVMLVNFGEDFWNPSEIDVAQRGMEKVTTGKFVLVPASSETRGHYSFFVASLWKPSLQQLLASLPR